MHFSAFVIFAAYPIGIVSFIVHHRYTSEKILEGIMQFEMISIKKRTGVEMFLVSVVLYRNPQTKD
jgi:hypothetical protein